jgi:antitoxin MazE
MVTGQWIYNNRNVYLFTEPVMQVTKWGNSLGLRLPASLVKALELKPGVQCEVVAVGDRGFSVSVQPGLQDRLIGLRRLRRRLPAEIGFDREAAHERGR